MREPEATNMGETASFETTRRAFDDAAQWFVETVRATETSALDTPALGVWSVRDLVGHTARALTTVESYLRPGTVGTPAKTTRDYYVSVRSGRADPDEVAERGREAGRALGDDIARSVETLVDRILPTIATQDPDAPVATPVGTWPLRAYLPTRVFELVVHTGDLRLALGFAGEPPATSASVALGVLGLLAADASPSQAMPLLRALTGRGSLPAGLSLL